MTTTTADRKRMGVRDAVRYTAASATRIRQAVAAGDLPAKRNGTGQNAPLVFQAADLDRWVESWPDA